MNAPTGTMNILDHTGHTNITWNKNDPGEVRMAREMFDSMKEKGHQVFEVGRNNAPGRRANEFDPAVEKYMVVPQLVGG